MTINNLSGQVARVWDGLRPVTKQMLEGALKSRQKKASRNFSYDTQSDWEVCSLLSALDEEAVSVAKDAPQFGDIRALAETCVEVLQTLSESADVFIQLATRALRQNDFKQVDKLGETLLSRFSVPEICEVARQAKHPAIRAIAYETLAVISPAALVPMLEDPLYTEVARNVLEMQSFEYDSAEARHILENFGVEETENQ